MDLHEAADVSLRRKGVSDIWGLFFFLVPDDLKHQIMITQRSQEPLKDPLQSSFGEGGLWFVELVACRL